jgi:hypothetical protein
MSFFSYVMVYDTGIEQRELLEGFRKWRRLLQILWYVLVQNTLVFEKSRLSLSVLYRCLQFAFDGPPSMLDFYTRSLSLSNASQISVGVVWYCGRENVDRKDI